jgi:hypothetical protein
LSGNYYVNVISRESRERIGRILISDDRVDLVQVAEFGECHLAQLGTIRDDDTPLRRANRRSPLVNFMPL